LIAQLQALGKKLGRKPTDRDINAASRLGECASSTTFARMFGSLLEAYRTAGFASTAKPAQVRIPKGKRSKKGSVKITLPEN